MAIAISIYRNPMNLNRLPSDYECENVHGDFIWLWSNDLDVSRMDNTFGTLSRGTDETFLARIFKMTTYEVKTIKFRPSFNHLGRMSDLPGDELARMAIAIGERSSGKKWSDIFDSVTFQKKSHTESNITCSNWGIVCSDQLSFDDFYKFCQTGEL